MYKIMLNKDGKSEEITALVGELSWNERLETVGISLSFSVPDTAEKYVPRLKIEAGDIIQLFNDSGEMIRAVVVNVSRDFPKRTVKAFDFGFYFNKKILYAFDATDKYMYLLFGCLSTYCKYIWLLDVFVKMVYNCCQVWIVFVEKGDGEV